MPRHFGAPPPIEPAGDWPATDHFLPTNYVRLAEAVERHGGAVALQQKLYDGKVQARLYTNQEIIPIAAEWWSSPEARGAICSGRAIINHRPGRVIVEATAETSDRQLATKRHDAKLKEIARTIQELWPIGTDGIKRKEMTRRIEDHLKKDHGWCAPSTLTRALKAVSASHTTCASHAKGAYKNPAKSKS